MAGIFRKYDIRGLAPSELNARVAYKIAHAYFKVVPGNRYLIGYDMRATSPAIFHGIVAAANDLGKKIDSVGMVATDNIYFYLSQVDYDGGIMVTASHNPSEWNGIKFVDGQAISVLTSELETEFEHQQIEVPDDLETTTLDYEKVDYRDLYVDFALRNLKLDSEDKFKLVIDAGNGMGGQNIQDIMAKIPQIELIKMYFQPDAKFPNHEANPVVRENTAELAARVVSEAADLGIAFDGDSDRVVLIDEQGNYVSRDFLNALLMDFLAERNSSLVVVHDTRREYAIRHIEKKHSKMQTYSAVSGHATLKRKMVEVEADFGAETSGHIFYRETSNAENSALTVMLVLTIMSQRGQKVSEIFSEFTESIYVAEEQNYAFGPEVNHEDIFHQLRQAFNYQKESNMDGLTLEGADWRFNLRKSGTENVVRLNVEALSKQALQETQARIGRVMQNFVS